MSGEPESTQKADAGDLRVAHEGFISGTFFGRWMDPDQDIRTLVGVMLSPPQLEKSVRDFFDGFIAGAEAERLRRASPEADAHGLPFAVEWHQAVEIRWGDTEWVVGPQPGPWQPHRP
jgi:hypothetical protein